MVNIYNLCDNQSLNTQYKAEHGLSFYIEAGTHRILFDTGASNAFLHNADILGIALGSVDAVVLSHGHDDHTGGLAYLKDKKVYIHPELFTPKYKKRSFFSYEYIGNEYSQNDYARDNKLQFVDILEKHELFPGIWLIAKFKKEVSPEYFYIKPFGKGTYEKDHFNDELVLMINTLKGLVIMTGCAHSGIINIIEKCLKTTGQNKIYALLGGFHLSKLSKKEVKVVAKKIDSYKIENIGISHCTGEVLAKYLDHGNVFNFNTGDEFNA